MLLYLQKTLLILSLLCSFQNIFAQKDSLPTIVFQMPNGLESSGTIISHNGDTLLINDDKKGRLFLSLRLLRTYQLFDSVGTPILTAKGQKIVADSTKSNEKSRLIATNRTFLIKTKGNNAFSGRFKWQQRDTLAVLDSSSKKIVLLKIDEIEHITPRPLNSLIPKENYSISYNLFESSGLPIKEGYNYYRAGLSIFIVGKPLDYNELYRSAFHELGLRLSDYVSLNIRTSIIPMYIMFSPQISLPLNPHLYANVGTSAVVLFGIFGTDSGVSYSGLNGGLTYVREKGSIGIQIKNSKFGENFLRFSVPIQYRFTKNWVSLASYSFAYSNAPLYSQYAIGLRYLLPRTAFDIGFGFGEKYNNFEDMYNLSFNIGLTMIIGKRKG